MSHASALIPESSARATNSGLWIVITAVLLSVAYMLPESASAGGIDPALQEVLSQLSDTETTAALLILHRQADVPALDAELREKRATRVERHRRVVTTLQTEAQRSQPALLEDLVRRVASGQVATDVPYWITNSVAVHGTRAAIEELAARPDIAAIEPGFQTVPHPVEQVAPVPSGSDRASRHPAEDPRGIGVPQGLRAINAPRVWHELGIDGTGALIGVLDTGVDGNHPALRDRWRGNNGHPWQECWHDVLGLHTTYPNDDGSGHGTHVTGTLTGLGVATDDTIGVAWGAEWIAANAIGQGVGSEFNFDVLECLQWFADPDGNPETVDDVPDVVLNAWGVNEALGYPDCDSRWWSAIDNCEAAGIVLIWTAGGDGPAPGTIRSPGDRATTALSSFSVGSVDAAHYDFPYPITAFSSRGPSGCSAPDPLKIKPEVVAPGVDVYSSYPGGGYEVWSGSAMASAHVAGVVALLRSAEPDLEVDAIKQVLIETARDGGAPGEDNSYGWGTIDAYDAVARYAPASVEGSALSGGSLLFRSRPNPFGRETTFSIRIARAGPARLAIYDAQGQLVRAVLAGPLSAGEHTAVWDGRDSSGGLVPCGLYFSVLTAPDYSQQTKVLVVR